LAGDQALDHETDGRIDVLIGGGGVAGLALAVALRQGLGASFSVIVADPALDMPGTRSVSYGLQNVPPNALRPPSVAYSAMFDLASTIAPASRKRFTNVASRGGRSFAYCASAPEVVRMSKVSY